MAKKELESFSYEARSKIDTLIEVLRLEGRLKKPFAKRLNKNLFEIRVSHKGIWRVVYAYFLKDKIVVLSAFQKKTQKTPKKEIKKALKRLKKYK